MSVLYNKKKIEYNIIGFKIKCGGVIVNLIKDKLTKYMDSWFRADRFSGTVMVYEKDNILLKKGYGYANEQYKVINTVDTKYKIGSYTKQFTAVSILKLYEKDELDLEDTIKKYIPSYIHSGDITIHHLLSHTSGIPEHTNFKEYNVCERITSEAIFNRLNKRELNFKPGDRFEYSNSNYVLLAKIVEFISGLDIESFYQEHIFKPTGLNSTGVSRNEDIIIGLAQGYSYSGQGIVNADYYDMSGAYGSGFLYSNAEDLLMWIKALLGGKIIKLDTLRKMLSSYGFVWYLNAHAGYGCFVSGESANEMCSSGLISGYTFNVWVDIKNDCGVILLSNNDTTASGRIVEGIKSVLSGEDVSIEIKPIAKGYMKSHDILTKTIGKFKCQYTGSEFTISMEDKELYVDRLWIQHYKRKKFKLEYIEETDEKVTFACEVCDGKFIFTKSQDGSIKDALYIYDIFSLPYDKVE
jgi:CubicO group peptidase (beta-lactamase class C family)